MVFTTTNPPKTFFLAFEGSRQVRLDLGRVDMTHVWSEEIRTSRWTSGGTSGSTSGNQMDPGRVKDESGIVKGGFN